MDDKMPKLLRERVGALWQYDPICDTHIHTHPYTSLSPSLPPCLKLFTEHISEYWNQCFCVTPFQTACVFYKQQTFYGF